MTPRDPAHAVKILEALVEQGQVRIKVERHYGEDGKAIYSYLPALVDGAKELLKMVEAAQANSPEDWDLFEEGSMLAAVIMNLTEKWSPHMEAAGMEVPSNKDSAGETGK